MNLWSNLKSFGILALLLQIFILMLIIQTGATILILAIIFLMLAFLFSVNADYYDKFLVFINPELYRKYCEKDSTFIRKKRRGNIISFYLLAAMNGLNAYKVIMIDINTRLPSLDEFLPYAIVFTILLTIAYFSIILIKSANEDLVWNMVVGILFVIILFTFLLNG